MGTEILTDEQLIEFNKLKAYYQLNKEKKKSYYETNKEKIAKKAKEYREANKAKIAEQKKNYREANKEKILTKNKAYREANKEKTKAYREANKEKIAEQNKAYREVNKDYYKEYNKNYKRIVDKDKVAARKRERYKTEPLIKIKTNINRLINFSLKNKGFKKNTKTEQILGCTIQQFKEHLEGLFEPWMTWDNYGNPKDGLFEPNKTWDIDHIIPTSSGLTEDELVKLNHYTNLKPLCSYYNRWIKKDN